MSAAPDLFSYAASLDEPKPSPAWAPSPRDRVRARSRDYERLEPVALKLAASVGAKGFTADDLRAAATEAGIITGSEGQGPDSHRQRALSWFGPFLTSLAKQGKIAALTYRDGHKVKRTSTRPEAHANAQVVYCLPEFSRVI